MKEQIAQLKEQIGGMQDQLSAKKQEADLIANELTGVQQLWEQRLVSLSRLSALQRDSARLLGERGQLTASIAQAKGKISETELKILQVDQDFRSGVAKELADIRPNMPTRSRSRSPRRTRPRSSRSARRRPASCTISPSTPRAASSRPAKRS